MATRVVYPGTFDPVTFGHLDLIRRAMTLFDEVIVGVAHNPGKQPLFSLEERLSLLRRACHGWRGVRVEDFDSLVVEFCERKRSKVILRGLRMLSDFEYEFQMALANRKLSDRVETMFLMPSESYSYISARLIKEAAEHDADLSAFVPRFVAQAIKTKFRGSA